MARSSDDKRVPVEVQENDLLEADRYHTDPTYFPDGGLRAWCQVIAGFFVSFATWGISTSFGAFQTYFRTVLLKDATTFQLGWINSIQTAFILMTGGITGKLFDQGYFYQLIVVGATLSFTCFFLVAEATQYWQVLLAQGVGLGLGMGIMFGPTVACYSAYFKKRRDIVISVTAAGGGLGGVIFPIATNNLLGQVGYKWSIRILAFIELFCLCIVLCIARDRLSPATRRYYLAKNNAISPFTIEAWVDVTALRDPVFIFFVLGLSCAFFGIYPPFAFLQSFALQMNASPTVVKYITAILSATGVLGRFSTFIFARTFGPLNTTVLATLCCSVCLYSWQTITSEGSLLAFTIFYGFFAGMVGTFPNFIIPHLTEDITRLGVRIGMCFTTAGTFVLLGIPLSGLTLGSEGTHYANLSNTCGTFLIVGCILLFTCRYFRAGVQPVRI